MKRLPLLYRVSARSGPYIGPSRATCCIYDPIGTADLIRVNVDVQHVCQCADLHLHTPDAIPVHASSRDVFLDTGIISSEVMAQ